MKFLILAVFLLPSQAFAKPYPCKPESTSLCTPDEDKKTEIMKFVKAGIAAKKAMKEADAEFKKIPPEDKEASSEDKEARKEAGYEAWTRKLEAEKSMNENFNLAIQRSQEYYHAGPVWTSGAMAKPRDRDGRGQWADGVAAAWNPEFYNEPNRYYEFLGSDGELHYTGGAMKPRGGGNTYPNGATVILPEAFERAAATGNPGVLAAVVYHESRHFNELLGIGWDSHEEGEARTYRASLDTADIFELTAADGLRAVYWDELKKASQAIKSKKLTSYYATPEDEAGFKASFYDIAVSQKNLDEAYEALREVVVTARMEREAKKWNDFADREEAAMKKIGEVACRQELRPGQALGSASEALNFEAMRNRHLARLGGAPGTCAERLYTIMLMRLDQGWALDAGWINDAVPEDSFWKKRRREIRDLTSDAHRCWMEPHIDAGSMTISGFEVDLKSENKKVKYIFDSRRDAAAIRANHLLAYACLLAIRRPDLMEDRGFDPACNAAVPDLNARWDDMDFQKGLSLVVKDDWGDQAQCLDALMGNLKFPLDAKGFKKAVAKTSRQLIERKEREARASRDNAKARKDMEEHNRRVEERMQRAQDRKDSQPRGGIDTKPAEDAIGRARNMKFPP